MTTGIQEHVILVNERDEEIGQAEKLEAHLSGALHRAFSVFVFNSHGEMLIQRRADHKYHSAGLWSNTCCSHPRPGEKTEDAAHRRLKEEMGFDCALTEVFGLLYKVQLGDLYEHEYDHVYVGHYDSHPQPNADEASAWRWVPIDVLTREVHTHPEQFTYWFRLAFTPAVWCWEDFSSKEVFRIVDGARIAEFAPEIKRVA